MQKAERKGRTKGDVDRVVRALTGRDQAGPEEQLERERDFRAYFDEAPALHPNSSLIQGVVCGVRVEEVEDPLMRKIRYLDELIDELAKGRAMEKTLRTWMAPSSERLRLARGGARLAGPATPPTTTS